MDNRRSFQHLQLFHIQRVFLTEFKSFSCLDFRISASELNKAICNLKNGKSPGLDMIGNELLKTAQTYLNPCLLKLFNAVFTSGIYPQIWSERYITPIFKAENPKLPQNCRGITICNSIGKVFNSRIIHLYHF
jgi:hypothetical protein